jgi:PEP-CTERM motif
MFKRRLCSLGIVFLALPVSHAAAVVITFEGIAPSGGLINVNALAPYTEAGFTFTPLNAQSAVFDSLATVDFPGDPTDFFGFAESNQITLTGPVPFTLNSLLLGPSTSSSTPTVSMTLVGNLLGGGMLTTTLTGLSTATLATLNWGTLTSVVISATNDSAIDNIAIVQVPEPSSLVLLGVGALACRGFRRKQGF